MSPRFYVGVWVLFAAGALLVSLVGELTEMAVVVFGFIAFGLVFTGMMCVLPGAVSHSHEHISPPMPEPAPAAQAIPAKQATAKALNYRSA